MGFAFGLYFQTVVSEVSELQFAQKLLVGQYSNSKIISPLGFYDLPVSQTFGNVHNPNITMPNKP